MRVKIEVLFLVVELRDGWGSQRRLAKVTGHWNKTLGTESLHPANSSRCLLTKTQLQVDLDMTTWEKTTKVTGQCPK